MIVRNKRILPLLLVLMVTLSGCSLSWPWSKKTSINRATPDGLYEQAVEYYKDGNYKKSVEIFQKLKEEYPLSKLAILAEMGIADSYFSGKDYLEAELAYREFHQSAPDEREPVLCHVSDRDVSLQSD